MLLELVNIIFFDLRKFWNYLCVELHLRTPYILETNLFQARCLLHLQRRRRLHYGFRRWKNRVLDLGQPLGRRYMARRPLAWIGKDLK